MAKDEISSFHSQVGKDKEAMKKDYQKAMEVIFAYDYGGCTLKHNIYGDQPKFSDGIHDSSDFFPPEFFVSPKRPLVPATTEDTSVEAHPSKVAKEPEENAFSRDQS